MPDATIAGSCFDATHNIVAINSTVQLKFESHFYISARLAQSDERM